MRARRNGEDVGTIPDDWILDLRDRPDGGFDVGFVRKGTLLSVPDALIRAFLETTPSKPHVRVPVPTLE